jgi:hypothetical protein
MSHTFPQNYQLNLLVTRSNKSKANPSLGKKEARAWCEILNDTRASNVRIMTALGAKSSEMNQTGWPRRLPAYAEITKRQLTLAHIAERINLYLYPTQHDAAHFGFRRREMEKCAAKNAINFRHAVGVTAACRHSHLSAFSHTTRVELVLSVVKLQRRKIFATPAFFCTFFVNFNPITHEMNGKNAKMNKK